MKMTIDGTTTFNPRTNKFACQCGSELDGAKATKIARAIVGGKVEKGVFEIRCQTCGNLHWITKSEIANAQREIENYAVMQEVVWAPARARMAELRKIWLETSGMAAKVAKAEKLAVENDWNREFSARFTLVAAS